VVLSLSVSITLPKKVVEKLEASGLSVIDVISLALGDELDPSAIAEARLDLAEKHLEEAKKYIAKGNAVQASEKLYKVVEECVKALAEVLRAGEAIEAKSKGRWFTWLLGSAARSVAEKLGEPKVVEAWAIVYDVHVWGFHEAKYSADKIAWGLKYVERLLEVARRVVRG
jgi:plasmid stabilization system protein ParE